MTFAILSALASDTMLLDEIVNSNHALVTGDKVADEYDWLGASARDRDSGTLVMIASLDMPRGPQRAGIYVLDDGSYELHVSSRIKASFMPLAVMSIDTLGIDAVRRILSHETSGARLGLATRLLDAIARANAACLLQRSAA